MKNSQEMYIALPKGRVMREAIPILEEVGIIPEKSFFDNNTRVLQFSTNKKNIKIIKVRSFDVATFLIYGAVQIAIIGSDVLDEFNHSEIYSPIDLDVGHCRMVVASSNEILRRENPLEWSYVRVATKYPNITKKHFEKRGVHAECIKLNGAMEIAPKMSLCRRIVDLVDTGKTLEANGLIEVEEITKVSTRLAINRTAYKTRFDEIIELINKFESINSEKQ